MTNSPKPIFGSTGTAMKFDLLFRAEDEPAFFDAGGGIRAQF